MNWHLNIYLIWNSMPDMDLLSSAFSQKPVNQVICLSNEQNAGRPQKWTIHAFFSYQWLQLNKLGEFPPTLNYIQSTTSARKKHGVGSTQFFSFQENLSVRKFVDSTWSMLNPRLALHYGIPDLPKAGTRK